MPGIQRALEGLARDRAATLGNNISIGLIAVDNESGDVLAHVGSPDYFDDRSCGAGRYDPRGAFSGLDAEAVHLWPRL
jgi:membrane carboxypeptidase/penicillin-binding protein PbpC